MLVEAERAGVATARTELLVLRVTFAGLAAGLLALPPLLGFTAGRLVWALPLLGFTAGLWALPP